MSLAELRLRATTGADGEFTFGPLAPGRYTLSVRRSGYAPAVVRETRDEMGIVHVR